MKNDYCTIYIIKNTINDKVYIGQTWHKIERRFASHKRGNGNGSKTKIHRALVKYGTNNFYIEEICKCETQELADDLEKKYIKEYDSMKKGYNTDSGGNAGKFYTREYNEARSYIMKGRKHTEEAKLKMSKAKIGNKSGLGTKRSEESKLKMSKAMTGNKNGLGKKMSEESKAKLFAARKAYKYTDEVKLKMSLVKKGKVSPKKGKHFPQLAGENSASAKFTQEIVNEIRYKAINDKDFSTKEIAKKYNVSKVCIQNILNNKTYKTANVSLEIKC
jgi:group I intron endonuclease